MQLRDHENITIFKLDLLSQLVIKKESKIFILKFLLSTYIVFNKLDYQKNNKYPFNYLGYSSDTVNLALPFARRLANTLRPLAVAILERKPCLFFLLRFEG